MHGPAPEPTPAGQDPALTRRARPVRRAWFASDMHLHAGDPETVARAVAWIHRARAAEADALFLLGDVFRAWLGASSLHDPGLAPFLDALRAATRDGLRVVLLHGNHDFLMGEELREALGVEVVPRSLDVVLGARRVRLLHGDAFCVRDRSYHRLHAVLRSRPVRWTLLHTPPRGLMGVAAALMLGANRFTRHKPMWVMDIVDEEVEAVLASGVDAVICGHVHRARDAELERGRLVVMADFESTGSHAVFDEQGLRLVARDESLARPRPPVLAIDGPAGSGKSTISRLVAERLGWLRLDTGALYRAVTLAALRAGLHAEHPDLGAFAAGLDLRVDRDGGLRLDGDPVPDAALRSAEVAAAVSPVSAVPAVRAALLDVQRQAAHAGRGLVAEGRDMATVVFPDAELAVYLDALPEVRAARRLAQNPGEGESLEAVAAAIAARDARDSTRATAPLARAEQARLLDTSELTTEQVVARVLELLDDALEGRAEAH